jgi:predicted small secreted protein|tara:strand:- start:219 stop:368 length:150 start_codon:yes stop_codon:yes gene_type:complete
MKILIKSALLLLLAMSLTGCMQTNKGWDRFKTDMNSAAQQAEEKIKDKN